MCLYVPDGLIVENQQQFGMCCAHVMWIDIDITNMIIRIYVIESMDSMLPAMRVRFLPVHFIPHTHTNIDSHNSNLNSARTESTTYSCHACSLHKFLDNNIVLDIHREINALLNRMWTSHNLTINQKLNAFKI